VSREGSDEPNGRIGDVLGYAGLIGLIVIGVFAKAAGTMSVVQTILLLIGYFLTLAIIGVVIAAVTRH
jgi:hypothetical protein